MSDLLRILLRVFVFSIVWGIIYVTPAVMFCLLVWDWSIYREIISHLGYSIIFGIISFYKTLVIVESLVLTDKL